MISFCRQLTSLNLITINRASILHNLTYFQKKYPNKHIWPVLKSNAYGHGLVQMVSILKSQDFDYYVVDSYYEALQIWRHHRHPVLLIGPNHPDNFSYFKFKNLALTIDNLRSLKALVGLNKSIKIHLKINTGMNRQGIDPKNLNLALKIIKSNPKLQLEGLCSHLADADNSDQSFTKKQEIIFKDCLKKVQRFGFKPLFVHLSATAGVFLTTGNVIRLGLGLYGYLPGLTPALRLTSTITGSHLLQKGDTVSYNRTFTAQKEGSLAIIPLGYFEGLDRRLSNRGFVKYKNKFYKIAGLVCMNLTCLDFAKTKPKLFAPVEIISPNPVDKNSLAAHSLLADTIIYELLVHLSPILRRQVI
ncbi:alanine racemase [Patescibacteria group bacterium]|nr:alanine racemase [Patescibacteria group bacterium]